MNDDLRRAIDEIKLRTSIEDVVRERVPSLRKRGRLWEACCPFHEEKTPSFKVDPARGTWHCFGACATGGDVIRFVERAQNVDFLEALRYLAARSGVSLPERRTAHDREVDAERERVYDALARAAEFYRRSLHTPDGARALEYLRSRGLERATIEAFGIGYAPGGGEVLSARASAAGFGEEWLLRAGLARRDERGRAYDFFRDRLMIPIRDLKGRVVGFGGRRLSDADPRNPKYVNTQDTEVFHKGRLIYGLDVALEHVRKRGHLVVVEGYTDVMAAHQVGLRTVVAVLGTATTDEHAALVRKSGARRVSLVFDGDDAGRRATFRALAGLVALEIPIDVVRIPLDEDPCDLLVREGAAPMNALLETATPWFEFVLAGLLALPPIERARAIDSALELVMRLPRALERDAHLETLAARLGFPLEGVRMQFETLPARQRERQRAAAAKPAESARPAAPARSGDEERERRAFAEIAGAALIDTRFARELAPLLELCADEHLHALLDAIARLAPEDGAEFPVPALMDDLRERGADDLVTSCLAYAQTAERLDVLFDDHRSFLLRLRDRRAVEGVRRLLGSNDEEERRRMAEAYELNRRNYVGSAGTPTGRT